MAKQRSADSPAAMRDGNGFGYGFATMQNPSWSLDQVVQATGGRLLCGTAHGAFRAVATDSRTIDPGDIFLALQGDSFDGHRFIETALKKGAAAVICSAAPKTDLPVPCVLVEDTLKALGDLASFRRHQIANLRVLAVTGSSGKTTVKEMCAHIMMGCGRVLKTKGNFNNLVGLPLSLLPINFNDDYAVLEMGMNCPGEIARLTEIADPDIACILNVHAAHLAGLGSIEGVAEAKGELFSHCSPRTTLVVNRDDSRVAALAKSSANRQMSFGRKAGSRVRATRVMNRGEEGMTFTLHLDQQTARVRLAALGEHNILNGLAAAAMAYAAGADMMDIVKGLESFAAGDKRLKMVETGQGLKVINDSYNANPASMQAAIVTVNGMRKGERAVAVLGDMLELGDYSEQAHQEVGTAVACNDYDYLLAVGQYSNSMVAAGQSAGMPSHRAHAFQDKESLVASLKKLIDQEKIGKGDYLLVKGSRGMRMEEIIENLTYST